MTLPCVILAGGLGTRMRPATDLMPKALLPVLDEPFCKWQLELLSRQGIEDVIYSVGYKSHMLRDYVGDGSRWNLHVSYVDEGEQLRGTGGALRFMLDERALPDSFFLLWGDSYLPIDYPAVEAVWKQGSSEALMTVFQNDELYDKSNVIYENGLVVLYDKSRPVEQMARMKWIDYGLMVLTASVVRERIPASEVFDLAGVFRDLSREGKLAGYEVYQRFYEGGSQEGMADLEEYLGAVARSRPSDRIAR